jgi:hypothetical protein
MVVREIYRPPAFEKSRQEQAHSEQSQTQTSELNSQRGDILLRR